MRTRRTHAAGQRRLRGMRKVMRNLKTELNKIEGKTLQGLIEAAIIIRRDMAHTPPKVPVDVRNLEASWFTVTSGGKVTAGTSPDFKGNDSNEMAADHSKIVSTATALITGNKTPVVIMGFSANYAIFVHENVGANFKRPGSGAKFLEAALKRNEKNILETVAKSAKI